MPNSTLLEWRDRISALWHEQTHIWWNAPQCGFATSDQFVAFCAAKDWLQDTAETLLWHRSRGFSSDPYPAYLEFWGILQAVVIQQDAIKELNYALTGAELPARASDSAWVKLRDLRNLTVGHPNRKSAGRGQLPLRSVSGREGKSYERIPIQVYGQKIEKTRSLNLAQLLDEYDVEASKVLEKHFTILKKMLCSAA